MKGVKYLQQDYTCLSWRRNVCLVANDTNTVLLGSHQYCITGICTRLGFARWYTASHYYTQLANSIRFVYSCCLCTAILQGFSIHCLSGINQSWYIRLVYVGWRAFVLSVIKT